MDNAMKPLAGSAGNHLLAANALAGGASNVIKIATYLILLPLMARLLGPSEFGLYAQALPIVAFFTVVADGGFGLSLAREDESASIVWSTAFWVLIATGIALCLLVTGGGLVLARIAQAPPLATITAVLSVSFLLISISILPTARLTRSGNLLPYVLADLAATIVGAIVAVTFALLNAGAMSLALQYVTAYAVRAAVLNWVAFYHPKFEFCLSSLRGHLLTGSFLLGGRLLDFSSRLIENVLLGRLFGAAALGAYTFANQVPRFICEAASNPTWSALYAHAIRQEAAILRPTYIRLCRVLASLMFPIAFILSAAASPIIALFLGPSWAAAAPILQILAPSYALAVVASQSSAVLLAHGRNATFMAIMAGTSLCRIIAVGSGYWFGVGTVVWAVAVVNCGFALAMFLAPAGLMGIRLGDLARPILVPLVASIAADAVCTISLTLIHLDTLALTTGIAAGGAAYLALMIALDGQLLKVDLLFVRNMILRRRLAE